LGQTYEQIRCLVVDNGSSDGTAEALGTIGDKRLRVLIEDQPLGAAGARNVGIAATETPWIAFLDNDDLWAPTKVQAQMDALAAHPGAAWSTTGSAHVGETLEVLPGGRLFPEHPRGGNGSADLLVPSDELLDLLKRDNALPGGGSSVLVSRELLNAAGGFHTDVPGCEDWDLWVRLAKLSPLVYLDRPLAAWRMWGGQGSTDVGMMLSSASQVRSSYFPELGGLDREYVARWWQRAARRLVLAGDRSGSSRCFVNAARAGRAPGQLFYAVGALLTPYLVKRRLDALESSARPGPDWRLFADRWLAPWRDELVRSDH
jgi:glycosyltransferase involved in cell wall biosynthesis